MTNAQGLRPRHWAFGIGHWALTCVLVLLPVSAFAQLQVLDVPFISQSENLCGGAAAAMVLRYWGQRGVDAESFRPLVDRSRSGITTTALTSDLERRGWSAPALRGDATALHRELDGGRPVIALIQDRPGRYHYVVVVAATDRAIVFHDPARAPDRVMTASEFDARWQATHRWMTVVTPKAQSPEPKPQRLEPEARSPKPEAVSPCDRMVASGVAHAQANDLDAAERELTSALACPGAAPMRELAGVRLLQRRYSDAASLASAAVTEDPNDAYLWRLLGTARFLLGDPDAALRAWNTLGEPTIDLVRVDGLARTRQPVVERLIGLAPGDELTPDRLLRARRRLADLPAAFSTRVDFAPVPNGLAELHAAIDERAVLPSSTWAFVGLGVSAAANREVRLATGSLTGGGESAVVDWRFWPDRPRIAGAFQAPAPWGGVWSVEAATERQPLVLNENNDSQAGLVFDPITRTTARLAASAWATPVLRVGVRGGVDRWTTSSAESDGTAGGFVAFASRNDRIHARLDADIWAGRQRSFATTDAVVGWTSSTARTGHVWLADAGVSFAADATPMTAWAAGDTGHARAVLLRAHPLIDDGRLRVERLGRSLAHASGEFQEWRSVGSVLHVAGAAFIDQAWTGRRFAGDAIADVDAGVGIRLAAPLLPGVLRVDLAKGLRDGNTAVSVVYAP